MKPALWVIAGVLFASGVWYYVDLYNPEQRLARAEQRNYRENVKAAETQLANGQTDTALDTFAKAHSQHQETVSRLNNPAPPPSPFSAPQQDQPVQVPVLLTPPIPLVPTERQYRFALDGKLLWQPVEDAADHTLFIKDGDRLVWDSERASKVCQFVKDPVSLQRRTECVGPEGAPGKPSDYTDNATRTTYNLDEYPLQEANFQALIAKIGRQTFQVGLHYEYVVLAGTGEVSVLMSENIYPSNRPNVTFGHKGTLTVISR